MSKFQLVSPFTRRRRPAAGDREAWWTASRRPAPSDAPGRHRLGQDVHHGQRHRAATAGRRWSSRTTRPWPPSSTASSRSSSPHNAVDYFVSYYDYYQPEAYIPQRDIYIEKDAAINEDIDRLRLAATSALVSRDDVIIVASVSCIYGLGSPEDYRKMMVGLKSGEIDRPRRDAPEARRHPVRPQRRRRSSAASSASAATSSRSGRPTRRSATASSSSATRSSSSAIIDPLTGERARDAQDSSYIYPAKHFVMPEERITGAVESIGEELERAARASSSEQGKLLEAQRLEARTRYDMEMLQEVGYCPGIENYSPAPRRPPAGRAPQHAPRLLPARLPADHRRVARDHPADPRDVRRRLQPQEHAGRARVPPAQRLDNRPMRFDEWEKKFSRRLFVSATPGDYELAQVRRRGRRADHPARRAWSTRIDRASSRPAGKCRHLLEEIKHARREGRARARHHAHQAARRGPLALHRGAGPALQVAPLARSTPSSGSSILRDLRAGHSTCWWASTCCARGSTCPRSRWSRILDADKEGFLRSETSLIQTIGRVGPATSTPRSSSTPTR